ncbi:NADH dehydrogenase 1, alpha/beta subcomplex subunit 1 ndufab1/ACP, partial [Lobulomyces angularis]
MFRSKFLTALSRSNIKLVKSNFINPSFTSNKFLNQPPTFLLSFQSRHYGGGPAPLEKPEIEERVMQLLMDFDKVSRDKLTLDSHFIKDLNLDSLDQVEITLALEDEFNIELPDTVAEQIFTPRNAIER